MNKHAPLITEYRKSGCTVTPLLKSAESPIFGHMHQPYVRPKWWHVLRRLRQFHYRMRNTEPGWWPRRSPTTMSEVWDANPGFAEEAERSLAPDVMHYEHRDSGY